jgi:prepilin-type N-terminal cleavage/methylation domain-containing protein
MASTTTTTRSTRAPRNHGRGGRGFTLVELLVSTGLGAIVLAAVLTSVLMINRSGYLLNNYIEMEKQARNALETFAIDARMTESVNWTRKSDGTLIAITLIPPDSKSVTYTYNSTAGTLVRTDNTTLQTLTLVSGIQSLSFTAYKYSELTGLAAINPSIAATSDTLLKNDTKMVQISLSAVRTRSTLADATNNVVSARYVLRNKPF